MSKSPHKKDPLRLEDLQPPEQPMELDYEKMTVHQRELFDGVLSHMKGQQENVVDLIDRYSETANQPRGFEWIKEKANQYNLWTWLFFIMTTLAVYGGSSRETFTGNPLAGSARVAKSRRQRQVPKVYGTKFDNIRQYQDDISVAIRKQPLCKEMFNKKYPYYVAQKNVLRPGRGFKLTNRYFKKGAKFNMKHFMQARIAKETGYGNWWELGNTNDLGVAQFIPPTAHDYNLSTYTNSISVSDTRKTYNLILKTQKKHNYDNEKVYKELVLGKSGPIDARLNPYLSIEASVEYACKLFDEGMKKYSNREDAIYYAISRYYTPKVDPIKGRRSYVTGDDYFYFRHFLAKWEKFDKMMKEKGGAPLLQPSKKMTEINMPKVIRPSKFKKWLKKRRW